MKPLYEQLKRQHYTSNDSRAGYVDSYTLFSEIGYDFAALQRQSKQYENTCAVRMSLALLKCNVEFSGRFTIKSGEFKGKKFEMGAKLLADELNKSHVFGNAEIYTDKQEGGKALLKRRGVVFFNKIDGYGGGHIDVLEPLTSNSFICNSNCYPYCKEIWFWELK
ncbi:T6SS effector amidase Tae4 family protein [Enterobacter sp. Bisph1]|uniref:T6SS effector amidase Tae4 family protein n=1 Tax=Enterobacter sp. Bisph1 TaxID=1274399 RepID=UPI00057C0B50|nr:T6SS effector amidase Tae4 family protein [Enterobacter sp. Bisph1]